MESRDGPSNQSEDMSMLQSCFQGFKMENWQLAKEFTALKKQLARVTSSWKEEKGKLLDRRINAALRAREDLDNMLQKIEQSRARRMDMGEQMGDMEKKIGTKNLDIALLNEHLRRREAETQQLEAEIVQSDSVLPQRVALEQSLRSEQEANTRAEEELDKKLGEAEKRWLSIQHNSQRQVDEMEEDVNLLILKNEELQELVLVSDKEKARGKEEEKKKEEKRLRRERKERKRQEKEEKKEEKRLKRERKERKRQEKKEKKEEEEKEEKKEKKEKKEEEEKEEEKRLKRERKERKGQEKKEKEEKEEEKRLKRERKEF